MQRLPDQRASARTTQRCTTSAPRHQPRPGSRWIAIALVAVALLAGCGRDRDTTSSDAEPPTPTSTTLPALTALTVPAAPVSAAVVPASAATTTTIARGLATPTSAGQNLWDAWRDNDTPRARLYASASAVDTLFGHPWRPEASNEGCGPVGSAFRCVFLQGRSAIVVMIDGNDSLGYRVTRVALVDNLATSDRLGGIIAGSDPADSDSASGAGEPGLLTLPGEAGAATVPTAPGASGSGTRRAGSGSRATATTKRSARKTTQPSSAADASPEPAAQDPAPAPAPAPDPTPAPTPVQAGGGAVEQVDGG